MQLFITQPVRDGEKRVIIDQKIIQQMTRVLRMKQGDTFCVQYEHEGSLHREQVEIETIDKKEVKAKVLNCKINVKKMSKTSLVVANPNSAAKAELIVQKLTEIGVGNIIFRASERSQAKFDLRKKEERLCTIIKEATEQSRGRYSPVLSFVKTLDEVEGIEECIVCDTLNNSEGKDFYRSLDSYPSQHKVCLVGPEGGWGPGDYEVLKQYKRYLMELGDGVLRMETAAIIAGWRVVNDLS